MQRFNADYQQIETLGPQAGSNVLFQQRGEQRLIWQLSDRMASAHATQFGIGFGQPLLIAVVVTHQQAQLIVLVQRRQHELMIRRFFLGNVFQLFGHRA